MWYQNNYGTKTIIIKDNKTKRIISFAKAISKHHDFFKKFTFSIYGADTNRNMYRKSTLEIIQKILLTADIDWKYYGHLEHNQVYTNMIYNEWIVRNIY